MAEPPPDRTATLHRGGADASTVDGKPATVRPVAHQELGKYTLERVLGSGGMGIVWLARDPDLERMVAIKLLHASSSGPEQRQRLLREARAMARLKHPNVLTVYEVDSDGDRDYIAMELVEGANLDLWLTAKPPADDVWDAVIASGRGLAAAHAAGLVHRDFKPHNVLRSRDGRVLVTDFGLARGTGEAGPVAVELPSEPVALAETLDAVRSDRILDSTLTAPGALIGTPAYMAPEQFTGSDPDPRTDQFAFCITAWQALAGARPFAGQTLDELRKSAAAGVANVPAKIPREIRAVLARGLAVVPEERWPDMDALLDALARARAAPKKRRALIIPIFAIACAILLFVVMSKGDGPPRPVLSVNGCVPPARAFDAWTTERRAAFEKRLDHHPNAIAVADAFDQFRTGWLTRYTAACAAPASPKTTARLNCLLGERDDLDGVARLTDSVPPSAVAGIELWGLLPALEACDGDSPVAPPLLPEERKQRDAIIRVRAELAALRGDPAGLVAKHDSLVERAAKLGWKPLVPEIAAASGAAAQVMGDDEAARTYFTSAADDALRLADYRLEATARIGLVEIELTTMADPKDGKHIDRLIRDARDAVDRAGNDPALATSVETLLAAVELARGKLDDALGIYDDARKKLIAAHALRAAGVAANQELHALRRRGTTADLDRAWQLGKETEDAIAKSGRPVPHGDLEYEMTRIAWRRGDLKEVHARADKLTHDEPLGEGAIEGRVVDAQGKPVANAKVAAWSGTLEGDATRIYTAIDPRAIAVTATDGVFRIRGGTTLIAEFATTRSAPSTSSVLRLAPTKTIHGHVVTDMPLEAVAKLSLGWQVVAPVAADGTFTLAGLPDAPATLVLRSVDAGNLREIDFGPIRDRVELAWPTGPGLDVIVRGKLAGAPWVTVKHTAKDTATAPTEPIGVRSATPIGAPIYERGDQHAAIAPFAANTTVTACASDGSTQPPVCKTVKLGTESVAVVLAR